MSRLTFSRLVLAAAICLSLVLPSIASAQLSDRVQKPAILLAAFGTSELSALPAITNVQERVKAAFPGYDVYLAFTSNMICDIWHKRSIDKDYRSKNPGISEEFYNVGNPLTVLGQIQARGPRVVLVQSLHVVAGEEFYSLKSAISQLEGIKTDKRRLHPFPWIGIGQPALGEGEKPGTGTPSAIERAAKALAPLAEEAKKNNQALVIMGHGNAHMVQPVYAELQKVMRKMYGPDVFIGLVEGEPGTLAQVVANVEKAKKLPGGIFLAPLMVVAGDHTINDLVGPDADSWASTFKAAGYKISTRVQGLGSMNAWADIYVDNLKVVQAEVEKTKAADEAKAKAAK